MLLSQSPYKKEEMTFGIGAGITSLTLELGVVLEERKDIHYVKVTLDVKER